MSLEPIPAELFAGGHVVHLSTLRADGSPQSRPLWTIVHEGDVVFFTQATSPKARDVARDPRVALSVTDKQNPYRSAWVRGRVAKTLPHGVDTVLLLSAVLLAWMLRLSPGATPWLAAKIIGLVVYIGLGMLALRPGRPVRVRALAWIAALLTFAWIVSVALTKSPLGALVLLAR